MKLTRSKIAELSYDEQESILQITITEGAEMNLENTKEHYRIIRKLTQNKPYLALIDASIYFTIDAETLKFTSLKKTIGKRIASPHYNSTLANMLTSTFFKVHHNPSISFQLFQTQEEALKWLKAGKW